MFDLRWVIGIINGFTLAGVYYFIEQKVNDSPNVRALPGSFYFFIMIIIFAALLLRSLPDVNNIIEEGRALTAIVGIAYIIGTLKEASKPKSLRMSLRQ